MRCVVVSAKYPDEPAVAIPVETVTDPLTPAAPAFADSIFL